MSGSLRNLSHASPLCQLHSASQARLYLEALDVGEDVSELSGHQVCSGSFRLHVRNMVTPKACMALISSCQSTSRVNPYLGTLEVGEPSGVHVGHRILGQKHWVEGIRLFHVVAQGISGVRAACMQEGENRSGTDCKFGHNLHDP